VAEFWNPTGTWRRREGGMCRRGNVAVTTSPGRRRAFPVHGTVGPSTSCVRLIPDQECIESLRPLGLHGNVGHDGELRAAPRPVQQVANIID
jgi:hypothetical protein